MLPMRLNLLVYHQLWHVLVQPVLELKTLQERIKREEVVLTEKSEACLKLLVQIGQDTAILKQHSQLLAKQKDRIAHLKKVKPTS